MRVADRTDSDWLDTDPCFIALGDTPERRRIHYVEFMRQAVPSSEMNLIRAALQRGQLTGSARFVDEIEEKGTRKGDRFIFNWLGAEINLSLFS